MCSCTHKKKSTNVDWLCRSTSEIELRVSEVLYRVINILTAFKSCYIVVQIVSGPEGLHIHSILTVVYFKTFYFHIHIGVRRENVL